MEPNGLIFMYYFVKWFKICVWKSVIWSIVTKYAYGKVLFRQMVQNVPLLKFICANGPKCTFGKELFR